jgi:hypothetical protein
MSDEVTEYWKSIIALRDPKTIGIQSTIGYDFMVKIIYNKGLIHDYKYNVKKDGTIIPRSIDAFINGKYSRNIGKCSTTVDEKLLSNFVSFLYTCHNNLPKWKENYDIFLYSIYKLLRKYSCTIL